MTQLIPKSIFNECRRPYLDMSLMMKTPPLASAVQDILAHLPRIMMWNDIETGENFVKIVNHEVRNCRVHLEEKPKLFLYNMSLWVHDMRIPEGVNPNCPFESLQSFEAVQSAMVQEIWVDVLWCGPESVRVIYAVKERYAWREPIAANDGEFCEFSKAK
jgi:hypothetical protein